MLVIHPLLAAVSVLTIVLVAIRGWRYRFAHRSDLGQQHVRLGKVALALLGLTWTAGPIGVTLANRADSPPGASGHFDTATLLILGYGVSATLMLRYGRNRWIRRFHWAANSLLLIVVLNQVVLGVNRLYKFDLLAPVPQDRAVRQFLQIKFGLQAPPASGVPEQTYSWTAASPRQEYGGTWVAAADALVQSDCGCSGSFLRDWLTINNRFPLVLFPEPIVGDFDYQAEFRIDSGQLDQYAGLVFRAVDDYNYYVVRASGSEQSVSLARFNNGARQVLGTFRADVHLARWQSLKVAVHGPDVQILLDGQLVGKMSDPGWTTGRLGLGTKSDSIAGFRNMRTVPH